MINFKIIDADFFEVQISTLTPEKYPRIFTSTAVTMDKIKIFAVEQNNLNSFDFQRVLFHATHYNEITIDGVSFASSVLLMNALNEVLYSSLGAFAYKDYVDAQLLLKQNVSEKNQPNGYAGIGADGFIPNGLISTLFDDVIDVVTLPTTGEVGKIYQNTTDNTLHRWTGSSFVEVSSGVAQSYVDTKVGLTGNETIDGIKTFNLSPIMPYGFLDENPLTVGQFNDTYGSVLDSLTNIDAININQTSEINDLKNQKVSLTGNETINDVKTFLASPIVPDGDADFEAVNFRQLNGKQDKLNHTYKWDGRFFESGYGYKDIDLGVLEFDGNIQVEINQAFTTSVLTGTYIKIYYDGTIFPDNAFFTFKEKILFYDGKFEVASKFFNNGFSNIIRIYQNTIGLNPLTVKIKITTAYGNTFNTPVFLPFVPTHTITFTEPKALPVTYNPDLPILPPAVETGNIEITDFDNTFFFDLATAKQYIRNYITANITNESYSEKTYRFSVPKGTSASGGFLILNTGKTIFKDVNGYILSYGEDSFSENAGNLTIEVGNDVVFETGNLTFNTNIINFKAGNNIQFQANCFLNFDFNSLFSIDIGFNLKAGNNCFYGIKAMFKNTIKSINMLGNFCFNEYIGRLQLGSKLSDLSGLYGEIGTSAIQNFDANFCANGSGMIITVPFETETINAGLPDGDIQTAISNGATVRYTL